MNTKELATLLNGRKYRGEITKEEAVRAKLDRLVVVYGASDDLMEFEGAICGEIDCYDGGTAYLTRYDLLTNDCESDACPHFEKLKAKAATIEAIWYEQEGLSWTYKTDIPHETFEIVRDGELYCRGIVFALRDVKVKP